MPIVNNGWTVRCDQCPASTGPHPTQAAAIRECSKAGWHTVRMSTEKRTYDQYRVLCKVCKVGQVWNSAPQSENPVWFCFGCGRETTAVKRCAHCGKKKGKD